MTTPCNKEFGCLLDRQQSDGGWAYVTRISSTEPTCFAILALRSAGGPREVIGRACEWLARRQKPDGGWTPGPAVDVSTHVTSAAVLALSDMPEYDDAIDRAVVWLLAQSGAQTSFLSRLARSATGTNSGANDHAGWPWFPGEAAWVIPTSLGICALSRQKRGRHGREIAKRVEEARRFLLSRRCPDRGWNHGGMFRAGEIPPSYPETTGIALLALGETSVNDGNDIERSLRCGEQHARNPRSSEGESWLRLGLSAHGRPLAAPAASSPTHRDWTVMEVALRMIIQVGEAGRNPFTGHV